MPLSRRSYSAVRANTVEDRELNLFVCMRESRLEPADFRALCLARRAVGSGVLFKALPRACGTAFADRCESMSSII